MKGFALGLALKQRRKATRKSPIKCHHIATCEPGFSYKGDILRCGYGNFFIPWFYTDIVMANC